VSKEELGGAPVHGANGTVDNVVATEAQALAAVGRFLSFLPPNVWQLPPVTASTDSSERRAEELDTCVPKHRRQVFNLRRMVDLVVDLDTAVFEIGGGWGRSVVTALARLDGHPVGVVAFDSAFCGGALDADAARKLARFLRLCDTFHLPGLPHSLSVERSWAQGLGVRA
jgi:acetyl-CoA carboxylase carboxyltransferase component